MKKKKACKYPIVMLIDDNEIDNFINERIITGNNFSDKVYVHSSGKSAIEFFKNIYSLEDNEPILPDIIFLDINMPLMDGFKFIEEFDKYFPKGKRPEIIFLTSSLNPEDESKAKKYQLVRKYVRKPLTELVLSEL